MRLLFIVMMVVTTLAVSVAGAMDDTKLWRVTAQDQIRSSHTGTRTKRMLRNESDDIIGHPTKRPFIEDRLKISLADPDKQTALYEQWYKSGYTIKQVAEGLRQSGNQEVHGTYRKLAKGYAAYVKNRRPQQNSQ